MFFSYQGQPTDFRDIFYPYAKEAEGYRTDVYKDIYGNNTVGIGHLVTPADNLSYGDHISDQKLLDLFYSDYNRLNIETYIAEAARNYNEALAIAHFIWSHGDGQYKNSQLRSHVRNHDLDYNGMMAYLNGNWDIGKSKNQKVNRKDFATYYSATPWTPNGVVAIYNATEAFVLANKGISFGIVLVGVGSIYLLWRSLKKTLS